MHSYKNFQFTIVMSDILPTIGRKKKYAAKLHTLLNMDTKEQYWGQGKSELSTIILQNE